MPADASQFTRMRKLQAAQARVPGISNKIITHLSQPLYTATGLSVFLPSAGKSSFAPFNRINVSNARHSKLKIPGGNVFGSPLPPTLPYIDGGVSSNSGARIIDGGAPSNSGARIYDGGNVGNTTTPTSVSGGAASGSGGPAYSGGSATSTGGTTYSGGGP